VPESTPVLQPPPHPPVFRQIETLWAWVTDEPDGECLVRGPVTVAGMPTPVIVLLVTSRPENFETFKQSAQEAADLWKKPLRLIQARVEGYYDQVTPTPPPPFVPPPPDEDDE
jgi:hypothetical protein